MIASSECGEDLSDFDGAFDMTVYAVRFKCSLSQSVVSVFSLCAVRKTAHVILFMHSALPATY